MPRRIRIRAEIGIDHSQFSCARCAAGQSLMRMAIAPRPPARPLRTRRACIREDNANTLGAPWAARRITADACANRVRYVRDKAGES
jgi:hypothetical protein